MVAVVDPRPLQRVDVRGWGPLGTAGEGGALGGEPFDTPQVERSAVVIEQRQHRVGAFGHPECASLIGTAPPEAVVTTPVACFS